MLLEPKSLLMAVVNDLLEVGRHHFHAHVQGEEGCALGTPVVVEKDSIQIQYLQIMVDQGFVHIDELAEQRVDRVLLLLVDQGQGGAFKIHKADEPLKNAVLEGDVEAAGGFIHAGIETPALVPIQGVNIRELDDLRPVVGVQEGGVAGLHHAAARGGNKHPFYAEQVLTALFLLLIGRTHIHDLGTGHMVDVGAGFDVQKICGGGKPIGLLPLDAEGHVFPGGDGRIVFGGFEGEFAAEGRGIYMLAYDLQFVVGIRDHFITSCANIIFLIILYSPLLFNRYFPEQNVVPGSIALCRAFLYNAFIRPNLLPGGKGI